MLKKAPKKAVAPVLLSSILDIFNIEDILKHAEPGVPFIFDIDNTILRTVQLIGSDQWFEFYLAQKQSEGLSIQDALSDALKEYYKVHNITDVVPVENKTVEVIQKLQKAGHPVFCLTSRGDGIKNATIAQLQSIGLSFNNGKFKDKAFQITENTQRSLYQGVIFCEGGRYKGPCLEAVCEFLDWKPKKACFVEDKKSYIENVLKSAEKLGMTLVGLRYGHLDEAIANLDKRVAAQQLQILQNPLISDEEAQILAKAKTQKKSGVFFKENKPLAVLWSIGSDVQQYQTILDLCKDMKQYRRKAKVLDCSGHHELCFRFKLPYPKLAQILPLLEARRLLTKEEAKEVKGILRTKMEGQTPFPIVHEYKRRSSADLAEKDEVKAQNPKARLM